MAVVGVKLVSALARYVALHVGSRMAPTAAHLPQAGRPRVVISLTTIPSRITRLRPTLNSLLAQDYAPSGIYLAVPRRSARENRAYQIPVWLAQHPAVAVIDCERDWGPASKLLPALLAERERPDTLIIAVDDDNVYPREMVATFVRFSRKLPHAALCFRGHVVPPSGRWKQLRPIFGTRVDVPTRMDIVTGCGGILVKPAFFDQAVFNYESAPPSAFFVDDIWFSGHLARRGILRYVIPSPAAFVYLATLTTRRTPRLDKSDNAPGSRHNDIMLDYFRSSWGVTA
jgi:hypothetical protein